MRKNFLLLALAALLPLSAQASGLDYSYVEGGYTQLNDHGGPDADGLAANASFEFGNSGVFVHGGWSSTEFDDIDVDADLWRLGLGYHHALDARHDLVVSANYLDAEFDHALIQVDADGYEAELGLRSAWSPRFETLAAIGRADGGDIDGESYARLAAQYRFNDSWGMVASARIGEDVNEWFVGPRLSF